MRELNWAPVQRVQVDPTDLQKYHWESPEDTCLEVRDSKIVSPKEGLLG